MNKIRWCLQQKNGIEIVEPNENLKDAYLKKAEDSLRAVASLEDNRDWEISSSYYAMYFSLYAILQKIGVKCEIHSCTINFMKIFLKDHFTEKDIHLLETSQKARIDAQYYSDRNVSDEIYNMMTTECASFLAKCRQIAHNLTEQEINDIRKRLSVLRKKTR
ncbi:MAG: HEPN domain-containing protein [Nanoarchaeota archaeon]